MIGELLDINCFFVWICLNIIFDFICFVFLKRISVNFLVFEVVGNVLKYFNL